MPRLISNARFHELENAAKKLGYIERQSARDKEVFGTIYEYCEEARAADHTVRRFEGLDLRPSDVKTLDYFGSCETRVFGENFVAYLKEHGDDRWGTVRWSSLVESTRVRILQECNSRYGVRWSGDWCPWPVSEHGQLLVWALGRAESDAGLYLPCGFHRLQERGWAFTDVDGRGDSWVGLSESYIKRLYEPSPS